MGKVVIATVACCLALAAVTYADTKAFEGVDVSAILKNPDAVKGYVTCLLKGEPCDESQKRLKDIVPNALLEKCSKCNEHQKKMVGLIALTMSQKSPQHWEEVLNKYDPKKEHRTEIAALIKEAEAQTKAAAGGATTPAKAAGSSSTTAKPKSG